MQKRNLLVLGVFAGAVPFAAPGPVATACPFHNSRAASARAAATQVSDVPGDGSLLGLGRSEILAP